MSERARGRQLTVNDGGRRPPTSYRPSGRRCFRINYYTINSMNCCFSPPILFEFYLHERVTLAPPRRGLIRFDRGQATLPSLAHGGPSRRVFAEATEPGYSRFSRPFRSSMLPYECCGSCQNVSFHVPIKKAVSYAVQNLSFRFWPERIVRGAAREWKQSSMGKSGVLCDKRFEHKPDQLL